uniref:WAP four-disulfide core domain 2 n=1 Tax=Amphiprion percula TaxID=161767 RepID=A0A3P8TIK4_AMPPE
MEKLWCTVCVLIFAFGALVHFDTVFAGEAKGNLTAKPGVCPRRHWGVGVCAEFCSNDSDCPNDEKCCSNGCGHDCMAPYIGEIQRKTSRICLIWCRVSNMWHTGQNRSARGSNPVRGTTL